MQTVKNICSRKIVSFSSHFWNYFGYLQSNEKIVRKKRDVINQNLQVLFENIHSKAEKFMSILENTFYTFSEL